MKKADRERLYGLHPTMLSRVLTAATWALIAGVCLWLLVTWQDIPARIPGHYNAKNEITGYTGKGVLWLFPALALMIYGFLSLLLRFPQLWNVAAHSDASRAAVYRLTMELVVMLRLAASALFMLMTPFMALEKPLPGWYIALMLAASFVPLVWYLVRAARLPK